jgi:hypothetical protein
MSITVPSFFWNNTTQRMLSQSNNISYATRGIYRVHETEGPRKGDYWFRDFGMTMACGYMTELGFRAADTVYAIPLLTEAMQLHQLSQNPLYQNARNYSALPEIVRQRMMGSLVNKTSASLVPSLMKELELRQGSKLPDGIRENVQKMLAGPIPEAEALVAQHLDNNGLQAHTEDIQRISAIENPTRRADALAHLKAQHPHLDITHVENAVKLEDARQMSILMDHLHRHLNFSDYLEKQYLTNHKLASVVSDVMKDYADKLTTLQTKGKNELPTLLDELFRLPINKREEAFNKKFNEILGSLELKNGVLLATQTEYQDLQTLGERIRPLLKEQNPPNGIVDIKKDIAGFYTRLANKEQAQHHHLETLWKHTDGDIRSRISKKVEEVLTDVTKLANVGKDRGEAFIEKLDDLKLSEFLDDGGKAALDGLKDQVKGLLQQHPAEHVSEDTLKQARKAISDFMGTLSKEDHTTLLRPLVNDHAAKTFKGFLSQSLQSKHMADAIGKIQKNSTWPKMAATVLLNLIFYGFLATNFDNRVLQPFQSKLAKERGSAQEIVTSGYLATIPAALILSQMFDKVSLPMIRRMGYFTRFAVVGGAALATFAGSTYAILMNRLKRSPAPSLVPSAPMPASVSAPNKAGYTPIPASFVTRPSSFIAQPTSSATQPPFSSRFASPFTKNNGLNTLPHQSLTASGFPGPNAQPLNNMNGTYAWTPQAMIR